MEVGITLINRFFAFLRILDVSAIIWPGYNIVPVLYCARGLQYYNFTNPIAVLSRSFCLDKDILDYKSCIQKSSSGSGFKGTEMILYLAV